MSYKKEFEDWLATRPESIQSIASKYPPGEYIVNEDAPYAITAPGVTVDLYSYREDDTVGVVLLAENKTEKVLEHEAILAKEHGRSEKELENIHATNVMAHVDPTHLTLVKTLIDD